MKWRDRQGTARRVALLGGILGASFVVFGSGEEAHAQIAGTNQLPIPNVLLLIDSSGSMERMSDNTLPKDNNAYNLDNTQQKSQCIPGTSSLPNRWGMLVQALTGNLQPYFSCDEIQRTSASFKNEFRIGGAVPNAPYDADYYLPYHRPLSGPDNASACAFAPSSLPGAANGNGLGPAGLGSGGDSSDFPTTAFQPYKETYLRARYGFNNPLANTAFNTCTYDQAVDGQLDATRDYVRFGLMTFDNDPDPGIGVATYPLPNGGSVYTGPTPNPFTGQWSYIKSVANPNPLGFGIPANCTTTPIPAFEVGARHWAAPPWEGRMVRFPSPTAAVYDIENTNDQIQQVLMGMRPYGATPIDGMMEDARDYLWYNDYGPNGSQITTRDPYVASGGCRPQYIILLTDGAPNLDLRPSCAATGAPNGICPYPNRAAKVADLMAQATGSQFVQTYVIGFSVNNGDATRSFPNDGFPPIVTNAADKNCKAWFNMVTSNGSNPTAMHNICGGTPGPIPVAGSTADACCQLSEIAYYGSKGHDVPPFFAESQADLVLSFGRVLGGITKTATTRTVPGYSTPTTIGGYGVSADFVASFIPNAQKVWSGEIDRQRFACTVGGTPAPQAETVAAGDSFASNLASQAGNRRFVSVQAADGSTIDSLRTIRPWATGIDSIPVADTGGSQIVEATDMGLSTSAAWAEALGIDDTTCKRSRANDGTIIPSLTKMDCLKVIWGFATATPTAISALGYPKFNVRCTTGGAAGATNGNCSVSGNSCTPLGAACPIAGEVCVPQCSELGAIFRSSPQLVGPPNNTIRDDNYRSFADQRKTRRPAMFVATTDGVLHAFKALGSTWGGAVPSFDAAANQTELWSFMPPAVLPRLASNYPSGQQILLDGTPAVKDIIWDRTLRNTAPLYHTTLAAGLGTGGGGYYGLSITDWDCQGPTSTGIAANPTACLSASRISTSADITTLSQPATQGPQFLWQLTDVQSIGGSEVAKPTHKSKDGKQFVALFGKQSGNPALATISADVDGNGQREVGIAVLPGGIDGAPVDSPTGCQRAVAGGTTFAFASYDASDNLSPFFPRQRVRQWAADCNSAVPGRNVTIVRADTGEIIRVFGRPNQDVPTRLNGRLTPSPFDSPIIGTPVVYPNGVGVNAQKIFVGDADGTVWRIDISSPQPNLWRATLFADLVSSNLPGTPGFKESQPIQIPMELTQDPYGGIVIAAATGDQENIVVNPNEKNYLFAVQELPATASGPGRARVRWYQPFTAGQRVTGPMSVFDRALYFATFSPTIPNPLDCTVAGGSTFWGMDYFNANGGNNAITGVASTPGAGGVGAWCPLASIDAQTGACLLGPPLPPNEPATTAYPALPPGAMVPGVTVRASPACASFTSGTDPAVTGMSTTTYSLFFGATAKGTSSTGSPQAARSGTTGLARPLPKTPASIDSWAFVVD